MEGGQEPEEPPPPQVPASGPPPDEQPAAPDKQPASSVAAGGSVVDRLLAKPGEVKQWWTNLTAVFDTNFLVLIGSVYFLQVRQRCCRAVPCRSLLTRIAVGGPLAQGMGGFANYLQKFYAMRSYTSTGCPCMLDDSCAGPVKEDCHEGLGLEPAEQTAIRVFGSLPWNYKIYLRRGVR